MIRIAQCSLLAAALLFSSAWAQESAVTRRAVEVREAPGDQSRGMVRLPAQSPVTRTSARQGPWVQVRTAAGATGWLHLFDLGPAAAPAEGGGVAGNALRSVTSLFGGSRPTQTGSTAGIRGLGAEDIAQAQPNPAGVRQLEAQRQSEAEARSFADRSGWRPAAVEALPEPARVTTQPAGNPGQPQSP